MSVVKFNKDYFRSGIGFVYYCFIRSWPLSIASTPVNYDSGSVLKLNVTFRYERYVMENVTKGMIRSGWKGYSDSFDPWMGRFDELVGNQYFGYDRTSARATTNEGNKGYTATVNTVEGRKEVTFDSKLDRVLGPKGEKGRASDLRNRPFFQIF